MSKQQDELLIRVDQLLVEVVSPVIQAVVDDSDTTGLAAEGTRKVATFINSEVQAVLERLSGRLIEEGETTLPQVDVYEAIEEVRKDYE